MAIDASSRVFGIKKDVKDLNKIIRKTNLIEPKLLAGDLKIANVEDTQKEGYFTDNSLIQEIDKKL